MTMRVAARSRVAEYALVALPAARWLRRPEPGRQRQRYGQANAVILRICRRAGLPDKRWHTLHHTFGTHAALCGVKPWSRQAWMGHERIDETMLYVHVAKDHRRDLPPGDFRGCARV